MPRLQPRPPNLIIPSTRHTCPASSLLSPLRPISLYFECRGLCLLQVAKKLSVSSKNLSKITGSLYFEPGRFNLGLNIKFSGKNLQVPGYTRKIGDNPWEFSERAIQLIADYKAKFPRVFELLDFGEDPYNIHVLWELAMKSLTVRTC